MSNKEKQIEEMAKIMRLHICKDRPCKECDCHGLGDKSSTLYHCDCYYYAQSLVEHYQPKFPENSVVLSREEYEKLNELKAYFETCGTISTKELYDYMQEFKEGTSKETTEKIIKQLKKIIEKALKSNYNAIEKREEKHPYLLEDELFTVRCKGKIDALTGIDYELNELAKQFSVEIDNNEKD